MIIKLKRPSSHNSPAEESANTRRTVEGILDDIKKGGEAAVRAWSQELDHWNPASFQLSEREIERCLSSLPKQTLQDIRFAQQQIRHFAEAQRASIRDIEIETLPGVRLGHRNIPVQSVGCYVPGGRYPMVASAHMSIVTARVAGVKRIIGCTPPQNGKRTQRRSQQ
jgi:sulfopropanediol 3-dehydrogenase